MAYLLTHIVDDSAQRAPDHSAFRFLDQSLSYAELAASSNQLAWLLAEQGVQRGDRVGILMHKSIQSPLALYGIMKSGAAYVPLDPGAPAHRLRDTIAHCGIRHLIVHPATRARTQELLASPCGIRWVIGLDALETEAQITLTDWSALDSLPADKPPASGLIEQDLGYIMYTSGSTGRPKGIMHTHASGLAYARLSAELYGINSDDRLSNHSPLHFDMSTLDYFSGPLQGASTVIIPEAHSRLPASLAQLLAKEKITIWYSVPFALIQALTRGMIEQYDMSALRWVLFGGEPFPNKHLNALRRLWPHARFSNVYGPAEVNQCTYYHLPAQVGEDDEQIPIGRIWNNSEGLIVDQHDQPVAPGEAGELLVRTPTMMRGYWKQAELNEKAFYHRPVTEDISDRFYRTGDLVQMREDGEMLFLGRKDRQIKTRGYRVELDEVESVLVSHPQIIEAAVFPTGGENADAMIGAAVIASKDAPLDEEALRNFCAQHLPSYALPQQIALLASFPRTTSGKIDRRALHESTCQENLTEIAS